MKWLLLWAFCFLNHPASSFFVFLLWYQASIARQNGNKINSSALHRVIPLEREEVSQKKYPLPPTLGRHLFWKQPHSSHWVLTKTTEVLSSSQWPLTFTQLEFWNCVSLVPVWVNNFKTLLNSNVLAFSCPQRATYFPEDRNMCKEDLQHSSKQLYQAAGCFTTQK